jgi:hypothetical protein
MFGVNAGELLSQAVGDSLLSSKSTSGKYRLRRIGRRRVEEITERLRSQERRGGMVSPSMLRDQGAQGERHLLFEGKIHARVGGAGEVRSTAQTLRSAKPFFSVTPSSGQGCALLFQREDKARDKAANIRLPTLHA